MSMRRLQILGRSHRSSNGHGGEGEDNSNPHGHTHNGNANPGPPQLMSTLHHANVQHSIWTPPSRAHQIPNNNEVHGGGGGIRDNERARLINTSPAPIINIAAQNANPNKPYLDFFEDREGAGGMRVGRDYQAKIPPLIPKEERNIQAETDKALLVWCPSERLTDEQVEQYLSVARDKYQYSGEQALGLLFWHRYDVTKALQDLGNFTPNPEEWTIEDKVLFEQAFQFHGKAFDRIRQMLPDKSMSTLIRYYYRWKKLRCKTSVMDRQVKKFTQEDGGDDQNAPPVSNNLPPTMQQQAPQQNVHSLYHLPLQSNSAGHRQPAVIEPDSDSDDIIKHAEEGKMCGNCGVPSSELHSKDKSMCNTCFLYWKRTGDIRPLTGPLRRGDRQMMGLACVHQRRTPPKGMYINHDDLTMLASHPPQAENVTLQGLEKEVLEVKCRVQSTKQAIEVLKTLIPAEGVGQCKPSKNVPSTSSRINSRWTHEELMLALQGVRRYGKNFQKIAEVMGTKSEAHLRSFYANYRRRYNLDNLVQEHNMEVDSSLDDVIDNNNGTSSVTPTSASSSNTSSSVNNGNGDINMKPRCLEF